MKSGLRIARILGIPIELDNSWFFIFILLTWSLATNLLPIEYPGLQTTGLWVLGVVTSLLFFASVLAHELGHAYFALRNNVPVNRITLMIFGGLAHIEKEPATPGIEFRIAIAGPLVSLSLAGIFGLLWFFEQAFPYIAAPSVWLARINLILAGFNMLPGFPLDGGRVLRAGIWARTGDFFRATRISAVIGQWMAFGFMGFGFFEVYNGRLIDGIWLIFIGSFLRNAASTNLSAARLQQLVKDVKVRNLVPENVPQVSPLMSIPRLLDEIMLPGGHRFVYVIEEEQNAGFVMMRDIERIPERSRPFKTAGQLMTNTIRMPRVSPDEPLWEALRFMQQNQLSQVAVVENGQLLTVLTTQQIRSYLDLRSKLLNEAQGVQ